MKKIKHLKTKYLIRITLVLIVLGFFGCASNIIQKDLEVAQSNNLDTDYVSCSGSGKLKSKGQYKGKLNFTFISQNDSTLIQFRDIMGRKTLMMWIEPENLTAWNILENQQYQQSDIIAFFPFLNFLQPIDLTHFFWGESAKLDTAKLLVSLDENIHIEIKMNTKKPNSDLKMNQVIFREKTNASEVNLTIHKRTFSEVQINLNTYWAFQTS
jgi:hypothetical protein